MIKKAILVIILTAFAGYFFHMGMYYYSVKCMYSRQITTEQQWGFQALRCEW